MISYPRLPYSYFVNQNKLWRKKYFAKNQQFWFPWSWKCSCLFSSGLTSHIPSRHFNDHCLVFPSSRNSTSSASWPICIPPNLWSSFSIIHDVFRWLINKVFMHQTGTAYRQLLKSAPKSEQSRQEPHFEEKICTICRQIGNFLQPFVFEAQAGESWYYVQISPELRRPADRIWIFWKQRKRRKNCWI